jgi:cyclophilin family peptidyl-prolyl cis-trans isomerase
VASVLPAGPGVASDRDPGVIGALVALEAMAREHAATFTVSAATVGRLRALVAVPRMAPRGQGTSPPAGDDRWLRRLAFMALQPGGQADDPTVDRALASDDDQLRRLAVRELAARPDGAEILRRAATNDPSPAVRFEALRAMVRRSAAGAPRAGTSTPASAPGVPSVLEPVPWLCDTLVSAIEDTSTHVALLAIDALPGSCPGDRRASERLVALASLAGTHGAAGSSPGSIEGRPSVWPQGTPAQARVRSQGWHRPAHALVALAAIDPPAARPVVLSAAQDPNPWMRLYAARAAGVMAREAVERASSGSPGASGGPAASPATVSPATAAPPESPAGAPVAKPAPDAAAGVQDPVVQALMGLAHDPDANVAEAAVNALRDAVGATGDDVYLHALHRSDYQLVMAAVRALARGAQSDVRTPAALLDALDRITRDRRETSRDPRLAILDALGTIPAAAGEAERLRPHLRDFDPAVAREAAALIERWTGQPVGLDARPLPRPPLPSPGDLDELARTRATIHVRDLGAFDLRLAADEAPLNAFRFITLARAGYYDGLTVHRVVPNFVVQGGSPGANEYAGAGPFSRDEIGVSNLRGTVGVSTRGRDTGDAQFYVNLADNLRLDGTYTVFARVERGMDIVDGLVEGDVIDRVEILTDPR